MVFLVHFVDNANYVSSFFAMKLEKLLVNGKIKVQSQTNMSPYYQTLQTTKMNFEKLSG